MCKQAPDSGGTNSGLKRDWRISRSRSLVKGQSPTPASGTGNLKLGPQEGDRRSGHCGSTRPCAWPYQCADFGRAPRGKPCRRGPRGRALARSARQHSARLNSARSVAMPSSAPCASASPPSSSAPAALCIATSALSQLASSMLCVIGTPRPCFGDFGSKPRPDTSTSSRKACSLLVSKLCRPPHARPVPINADSGVTSLSPEHCLRSSVPVRNLTGVG